MLSPILEALGLESLDQGLVPGINVGEPGDGDDVPVPVDVQALDPPVLSRLPVPCMLLAHGAAR